MKRFVCFCATVLLLFALITVTAQQTYANNEYFEVFFEGEALGVVGCPDEVRDMLADMLDLRRRLQGYQVSMDESIHFVARNAMRLPELTPIARIRGHIEDRATFLAHAISIHIDDVLIGVVRDEDEANRIFRELRAAYIAERESSDDRTRVISATIRQDVRMEQHPVNPEVIRSAHTVKRLLQQGDELMLRYRVQEGETAWGIAEVAGMSVESLAAANPAIGDITTLRPGDEIHTVELQPAISFVSEEEQWSIRQTPFDVEERKDNSLWAWQRVVQQQGQRGEVRVVVRTVMDNGQEVQRELFSEEELSAPVTHIVRQGTKPAPRAAPASGGFIRPARGGMLTSPFGWRGREFHRGIDLAMPIGSPVYASKSGTVTAAGWRGSYGNIVTINHGGNQTTLYAHLNQVLVSVGTTVSQGQVIAHSGNTGRSTGPHLHFEIHVGGSAQNPLNYISR